MNFNYFSPTILKKKLTPTKVKHVVLNTKTTEVQSPKTKWNFKNASAKFLHSFRKLYFNYKYAIFHLQSKRETDVMIFFSSTFLGKISHNSS